MRHLQNHPDAGRYYGPSLCDRFAATLRQIVPARVPGRQSSLMAEAKQGKAPLAIRLQRVAEELLDMGVDPRDVLRFGDDFKAWVREVAQMPALPLAEASVAEQTAQQPVDLLQCQMRDLSRGELEELRSRLIRQQEASAQFLAAVDREITTHDSQRRDVRARLGLSPTGAA